MRILRVSLIVVGCVAALGTLVLVLVARNPERRVARLLDEARIHRRTGRLDLATRCIEQALELRPLDAGLHAKLGRAWVERGDAAKAEPCFREALAHNPDDVEARFDLFDAQLERGELEPARLELDVLDEKCRVLASESARDRVRVARASLLVRRGDVRGAIGELEDALGVNPARDAGIRVALGRLRAQEGELAPAERLARDVWRVRPPAIASANPATSPTPAASENELHYAPEPAAVAAGALLARCLLARDAADEAVAVAREAWEREPGATGLAFLLADAEVARHGWDAALAVASKLESRTERSGAALVRARVAAARGEPEKARAAYREAVTWAPGAPMPALAAARAALDAHATEEAAKLALSIDVKSASLDERVARASVLHACGRLAEARADLTAVLESAPGHAGAVELLVRIEVAAGEVERLTHEMEALAQRSPGNGFVEKAKGLVALWRQDPGSAAAIERRAFQASEGGDASAAELMTAALVIDGGVGSAVRELERIASENGSSPALRARSRLRAAELYMALGRADLALPVLERGLATDGGSRELRLATARALIALDRSFEALAALGPLTDSGSDGEALVLAASAALHAKRTADAVAFARRALPDAAHEPAATALLALAARDSGDRDGAREAFARLRALRPSSGLGYSGALADLGQSPARVVPVLADAVAHVGTETFGTDLAIALDLAGRSTEALDAVKVASQDDIGAKKDVGAAFAQACILGRRGDTAGAQLALAQANVPRELRSSFAALQLETLGPLEQLLALRRHGLDREAAAVARDLVAAAPGNLVLALQAGRTLAAAGDEPAGERALTLAIQSEPRFAPARIELGVLRRQGPGGIQGAIAAFEEGLVRMPGDPSLELALGVSLTEAGRAREAEVAYRAVLALEPANPIARNNLAWALLEKGTRESLDEGLALARAAVEATPLDPLPLDTLARIELARGNTALALEHSRTAVGRVPGNALVRVGLAKALDATGDVKSAANEYEIALLLAASFEGRPLAEARLRELRGSTVGTKKAER